MSGLIILRNSWEKHHNGLHVSYLSDKGIRFVNKKKSFYLLFSNTPKITSRLSKTILRLLKEWILENTEASFKRFLNFREENLYPLSGKHQT